MSTFDPLNNPLRPAGKTQDDTLSGLLELCDLGWRLFPCKGKKPLTSHGFKDASADPRSVVEWAARWRGCNWAVATGYDFDVLDLDDARNLDPVILKAIIEMDGPGVITGGGGMHCYVAATGQGNRTKFLPGCDFRGRGGYVIIPPSCHASGHSYEWIDGLGPRTPIPPAPGWLLDHLAEPERAAVAPIQRTPMLGRARVPDIGRPTSAANANYVSVAVRGELETLLSAAEGTRNAQLNESAFALGTLVGAGLLDVAVAQEMLTAAGVGTGLSKAEVAATVRSGLRAGCAHPRGM